MENRRQGAYPDGGRQLTDDRREKAATVSRLTFHLSRFPDSGWNQTSNQ